MNTQNLYLKEILLTQGALFLQTAAAVGEGTNVSNKESRQCNPLAELELNLDQAQNWAGPDNQSKHFNSWQETQKQ